MIDTRPTPAQERLLAAIRRYRTTRGFPPTIRDLCRELGVSSPNAVWPLLKQLRDRGVVSYQDRQARTVCIIGEAT